MNLKSFISEESHIKKFEGCAPEGFFLIHEKTLEELKDFDIWKEWKNNKISIYELNKKNLEKD